MFIDKTARATTKQLLSAKNARIDKGIQRVLRRIGGIAEAIHKAENFL